MSSKRRASTRRRSTGRSSATDLTPVEIAEIFVGLTPGAAVVVMDHDQYIAEAKQHPFIQDQFRAGIYEEATFGEEFLSVARSFPNERLIDIDTTLICGHMKGVDLDAAVGYVAHVALHEYHHLIHHKGDPVSPELQIMREVECDLYLHQHHPDVMRLSEQAEAQSKTIQRVYRRMASLATKP